MLALWLATGVLAASAGVEPPQPPQPPQAAATGGWGGHTTWRLRAGERTIRVDPLDPRSLRAALDAAEEEGANEARAAATEQRPALMLDAQAVALEPDAPATLAADLERLREQFDAQARAAYEEAAQRLYARLVAEAAERDDEEALLLLV